ncbi:MAG: gliding motility protein GldL [Alloprevotella sp.]|nr:gliding motility protein GldL [Alloprevotella sp.]
MQKKSNIILTLITRLQRWMDSVPGQTFLNYAYSWGASIVILGALFKLTHLPGGNLMLFIGMGTEVIVFFLAAFDRPFDKSEIDKELAKHYVTDAELADQSTDGTDVAQDDVRYMPGQPAVIGRGEAAGVGEGETQPTQEGGSVAAALHGNSGSGVVVIGGGAAASPAAQVTEAVAAAAEAGVAAANAGEIEGQPSAQPLSIPHDADAEQLAAIIRAANDELLHRAQAVLSPEMEEATKVYIEKLRTLTETFAKVDEQSARLTRDSEEMENLNRTLTGINKVYELHLKSISLQVGTIDEINNQTHKLSEQIQHLNQVYGRMIEALTVNFARNAATAPSAAPAADEQQQ